ncbi:uncharacterized protein LOC115230381 [Octopus sinensis]|uniref:Uncharacterized protein LOC115230381 n=1 Tax=Octopus sinensis TaxID=2607531 RepID=A0A6P7TVP2_9MOLL|nr:uncharacterized protein LOC115230381 [Octopus sinensis]
MTTQDTVNWLAQYQLIKNSMKCENCSTDCRLLSDKSRLDKLKWKCKTCNFSKSIRDGSFFSHSHLELKQILDYIYFWALNSETIICSKESRSDFKKTSIDWGNFLRDVCVKWVEDHPCSLSGINSETMLPIVVEVDETKYFHRKYARGTWHEGHWVVGGKERGNPRNIFLVEVPDRSRDTLITINSQYLLS